MKYCDYCGNNIIGVKKLKNAITELDKEIYYHICKPLENLNPHKLFLRRWFWTPNYPLDNKCNSLDFCNPKCFEKWKLLIKEMVEEIIDKARKGK